MLDEIDGTHPPTRFVVMQIHQGARLNRRLLITTVFLPANVVFRIGVEKFRIENFFVDFFLQSTVSCSDLNGAVIKSLKSYLQLVSFVLLEVRVQQFLRDFLLKLQHVVCLCLFFGSHGGDGRVIRRCLVSHQLCLGWHRY